MTTFIGYSTINATSKVTLTDDDLVVQDLLNAFNIKPGSLPGKPALGCAIWAYLYEQQTQSTVSTMTNIVQTTCASDPRIQLISCAPFQQNNGVLFEVSISINGNVSPRQLNVFFNNQTQAASLV
jgi:phage baseplate assembly protein W